MLFLLVLNAFRHQRFNTAKLQELTDAYSVLNAFRHQRFNTEIGVLGICEQILCSTPFGIRDSTLEIAIMNL